MKNPVPGQQVAQPIKGQVPIELNGTKQRKRYDVAAGLKAVEEVAEYGISQAGLLNTLRTFHKLNQTDGFDCSSCAWPNPDGERSFAEFCENGFKAATFETQDKLLTRDFFRDHSIAQLAIDGLIVVPIRVHSPLDMLLWLYSTLGEPDALFRHSMTRRAPG